MLQLKHIVGKGQMVLERLVSTLDYIQVPNKPVKCVQKNKRVLLARKTRFKCYMKITRFDKNITLRYMVQCGKKNRQGCVMSDQRRSCSRIPCQIQKNVTLGRGGLTHCDIVN